MMKLTYDKMGLVRDISDPENILISSNDAVVINDKFPKAKHHFLVLPKQDIPTIFDLRRAHLPLLEELHRLAVNVVELKRLRWENFKVGFHALPSMQRLHLHAISKDFVSDYMHNNKVWNNFNTSLFLTFEDLFATVKTRGQIYRLNSVNARHLQKRSDLTCNQCEFNTKDVMDLKAHLLGHWNDDEKCVMNLT